MIWVNFFILLISLVACQSPTKEEKKELKINIVSEPGTLDPGKVRSLQGISLTGALFEGLTRKNPNGEPELALAKQVVLSEDGCTYTFYLRESKWTNGDPLTAHDFVYAWKRVLNPDFLGDLAFSLYDIKNAQAIKKGEIPPEELGVKAIDSLTLEVVLERRTPYFLQLVATPPFFPIHEKIDRSGLSWSTQAETYVSNGPFQLQKWEHQHQIVLGRNPNYWDKDDVKIATIQMAMVGDENTELQMFEQQEIDWAGSPLSTLSLAAIPALKKKELIETKPLCGTAFIRVNTERAPFDQVAVRRALGLSLNREEIMEGVTHGTQIPAVGFIPKMFLLQKESLLHSEQLPIDLGVTEITLTYTSQERNHLIAQAIQDQWWKIFGIKVILEAVESKVYFSRLVQHDYQLAMGSLLADFIDPINLLEVFKYRTGMNNTQWENNDYIKLLDTARGSKIDSERSLVLQEAEKLLMSEMPIIPLFHFNMLYLKNKRVKNVVLQSSGVIDFKWTDIEEAL